MRLHPFRFGVINEIMDEPALWFERVRCAEASGYSTWLLRDHFVPDFFGDQYAPLLALAMAAGITSTLRLGTMVLDNDYRHPVMLAKELATLDVLSGGRVELGLGAGWLRSEYEHAGIAYASNGTRIDRLEESIQVLKGLWLGETVQFEGKHYTINSLKSVPLPAQRPHPPLLIGGGRKRILRIAGREANSVGLLTSSVASGTVVVDPCEMLPAAVEQKLAWIREGAGERFAQIELSLIPTIRYTDDRLKATEQLIAERHWTNISVEEVWSMPSVLIGNFQQIADDLYARRERYGFSYYIISDKQMHVFAPLISHFATKQKTLVT